jgi:tetratricopeptide (TPR) repeat protein
MGCSLLGLRQLDSAMASANKAVSLAPDSIDNLILSARILHDGGKYEDAITVAERILSQDTSRKLIHNIRGHSLELLGHYNQALESYSLALSIDPNDPESLVNLGHLFFSLGQLDSSIEVLERAVENDPTNGAALKGLGYAYLSIGKIKAGMIALESRWLDPEYEHLYKDYMHLQWDGIQDLIGKTIWLWPEAGPKNMVIWSSTIPQLSDRSKRCIVEVSPKFVPLFSRSFPNVEVRETTKEIDQNLAVFDTHLPMGSLFLHSDIGQRSECDAFLVPDPIRVEYWRKRLAELGAGPNIGISWTSPFVKLSSAPNYTVIDDWKPIFGQKAVFINLQSGECQSDLEHAIQELGFEIHNFDDLDLYEDVDDVAALSAALDLAISVSNTVAAITAGVGTETWLLSWKESVWNNILHAPRGPKVVNFERSTVDTWETIFMDMASRLSDRSSAIAR